MITFEKMVNMMTMQPVVYKVMFISKIIIK